MLNSLSNIILHFYINKKVLLISFVRFSIYPCFIKSDQRPSVEGWGSTDEGLLSTAKRESLRRLRKANK